METVWEFNTLKEVPELGPNKEINFFNVHLFYDKLAKFVKKLPPGTPLILNVDGLTGDTSCVASMVTIERKLIKKDGKLVLSGLGRILKRVIKLTGFQRFL